MQFLVKWSGIQPQNLFYLYKYTYILFNVYNTSVYSMAYHNLTSFGTSYILSPYTFPLGWYMYIDILPEMVSILLGWCLVGADDGHLSNEAGQYIIINKHLCLLVVRGQPAKMQKMQGEKIG